MRKHRGAARHHTRGSEQHRPQGRVSVGRAQQLSRGSSCARWLDSRPLHPLRGTLETGSVGMPLLLMRLQLLRCWAHSKPEVAIPLLLLLLPAAVVCCCLFCCCIPDIVCFLMVEYVMRNSAARERVSLLKPQVAGANGWRGREASAPTAGEGTFGVLVVFCEKMGWRGNLSLIHI